MCLSQLKLNNLSVYPRHKSQAIAVADLGMNLNVLENLVWDLLIWNSNSPGLSVC